MSPGNPILRRSMYLAIGLLSSSIIAFQLALMHLLSIIQWSHFAYMVISVAMLGFGASGTLLAFTRKWFIRHANLALPLLMFLTSISMAGGMTFTSRLFISFDSFLLFLERDQIYALIITYVSFFVPFFLGALAIGIVYIVHVNRIGSLYFADLFGSGLGGLLALLLLWTFLPAKLPSVIALLPLLAGIMILPVRGLRILLSVAALGGLFLLVQFFYPPVLQTSSFKALSKTLNLPDAEVWLEKPSPYGFVQVVRSSALRFAPGLSLNYQGEIPVQDVVFNNGDWFGPIETWSQEDTTHLLDFTTAALPYIIQQPQNVLILEAGTGQAIAQAIVNEVKDITAVESHEAIIHLHEHELRTGGNAIFHQEYVRLVMRHPRSFLMENTHHYDLIILPTLSSFGGNSGIQALREQYLYTREAFREMYLALADDGMIAVSTWMDYPARYPLKLLATLREIINDPGYDPDQQLLALRSWGMVTFVLTKRPLSDREIARIRHFAEEMGFDPLLLPGLLPGERMRYNRLQDSSFFLLTDNIMEGRFREVYSSYDFNIRPATDQRPYFSQFLKWRKWPELKRQYGRANIPFLETAYLLVGMTFLQIVIAAFLMILLPLRALGWGGRHQCFTVLHFSGLGIGFMFIEIVLIQQFILFLGHPIYAAAVVLSALLLCSGVGSYFSHKVAPTHENIAWVAGVIVMISILLALFLNPLLRSLIHYSLPWKILISLFILAPIAFFMGMPFPLGLKRLSAKNPSLIPWAWGINGCWSVISTALATLIAVEAGFSYVMVLAAMAYAMVSLGNVYYRDKKGSFLLGLRI